MKERFNMSRAAEVMDEFMQKLDAGEFKKENQPNHGPKVTNEYVEKQRESYRNFLRSGVIDEVCKW